MAPELAMLLKTPKTLKIAEDRAGRSLKTVILELFCFFHNILVNERYEKNMMLELLEKNTPEV